MEIRLSKSPFSKTSKPLLTGILAFGFLFLSSQFRAVSADTNWINPAGHVEGDWANEAYAYDDQEWSDTSITVPDGQINSSWLELFLDSPITSDRVRFYTLIPDGPGCGDVFDGPFTAIEFRIHKNGAWELASYYVTCWNESDWTELTFAQGSVDRLRLRFNKQGSQGSQPAAINEVDFGEYVCGNTAPSVPTLSLPANGAIGQSTSLTLDWNDVASWGINCAGNANTYEVFLDTNSNPTTSRGTVAEGTTSKSISGLSNGTTYYWKVRALNGALSTDSLIWSFTTVALPYLNVSPTTVNFSATQGTGTITCSGDCPIVSNTGGGTLSWNTSPTSPDGWLSWTPASNGNGPTTMWVSATIDGLSAGNYQKQIVVSCSPQLSSCQSGGQQRTVTVNLTICANTAPSVPTLSSPSSGATGQPTSLTLDWNDVASWGVNCAGNTNTYRVLLDTSSNPATNRGTVPEGTTSLAISGLSNGTTYYWKVRARNGALTSDSAVWSFTTAALPCLERSPDSLIFTATAGGSNPADQNINISNSGGGTLSWASSDDQNSPNWLLTTDAGSTSTVSINISGLTAGTYTGTVTLSCNPLGSCQAGACQQKTTSVTLTVSPACTDTAPSVPTLLSPSNGATGQSTSPTVSWNAVSSWGINCAGNTNTYVVFLDTNSNPTTSRGAVAEGITSKLISGLSDGTTYYWKVRARNGALTSTSTIWSFTTAALPCLERSPDSLIFTATAGGSNPAAQNINISNSGGGTLSWASSDDQTWISTTDASLTATVSINISGLSAATYTGTVTLSCNPLGSCQAGACQQKTTAVTLTVNPAPVPAISRSPTSLTFNPICEGATSSESKTFEVWNSGDSGTTLNWSLSESASWFGVSPASGTSTGEHDTVTVTLVNTSSLTAGTYTSNITISDPNASNTPQTVPVSLTVNSKPCLESAVRVANRCPSDPTNPYKMCFIATAGGSDPTPGTIDVNNSGVCSLSWASSDNQTWITTTDASLTSAVSINISGLTAATYTGTVTLSCNPLSSCQAGACQQKTTSVTLTVNEAIGTISGCVWRDTNSVCPADGTPDANRGNAVEISATGYSTQTAGTDATGCYAFNSVPYNPSGTVYRVEVKKPAGEEDEWSYACAGGFDGQGFRNVTLETGTSNWTVGFSIINTRPGWFQVIDGDIHCEQDIYNDVP